MRPKKIHPSKPLGPRPTPAEIARFLAKIEVKQVLPVNHTVKGPCWLWTAHTDEKGYGQFSWHGKPVWAHRFSRHAFRGHIEAGQETNHECRRAGCVNPDHLNDKTHGENSADANRHRKKKREPLPF